MSSRIINNYKKTENDKVMNKVIKDTEKEVYKMYDDAVQEENPRNVIYFHRPYD